MPAVTGAEIISARAPSYTSADGDHQSHRARHDALLAVSGSTMSSTSSSPSVAWMVPRRSTGGEPVRPSPGTARCLWFYMVSKPPCSQPSPSARPDVEIRLSSRRRKYATAFWQSDRIVVVLPARLPRSQRDDTVDRLVQRVLRHRPHITASDDVLAGRAVELADRYLDGVRASSVRWSPQQRQRWGSCSLETRQIRISELLRPAPAWVVDAVLVHELAHLIEHGHGPCFEALVARYERTAEADAFLAGYALGLDGERRSAARDLPMDPHADAPGGAPGTGAGGAVAVGAGGAVAVGADDAVAVGADDAVAVGAGGAVAVGAGGAPRGSVLGAARGRPAPTAAPVATPLHLF